MANPSLQIGNSNWAIKEDNLLGYSTAGTRFVPQPITMTRESAGTRVNSSGLVETVELLGSELVDCGDFSCAVPLDYWSNTGTNTSVLDGNLVFNGNSANTWAIQSLFSAGLYNGKILKITYTISENTLVGSGNFRRGGYSGSSVFPSSKNLNTTVGTHTEYITVNSSGNNNALDLWITSGYTSGNLKISNISLKESTKNNLARVDYDGTASSLLVEPERTNTLTYSEDFTQWTTSGTTPTLTTGQLSPSGEYNATKISGTIGSSLIYLGGSSSSTTATRTIYARTVSGTGTARLMSRHHNVNNLFTLTEDWTRFELTGSDSLGGGDFYIDMRGTQTLSEFIVWGGQSEVGSYATSYIPTDGGTVTRVQDQYSKTGISNLINSEEGVLFAELNAGQVNTYSRYLGVSDGTTNNRVILGVGSYTSNITCFINSGGTGVAQFNFTVDIALTHKVALTWKLNEFKLYVNGSLRLSDTLGDAPIGLNQLSYGNGVSNSQPFYGKVKQLQVYTTALTDTQLAALTS